MENKTKQYPPSKQHFAPSPPYPDSSTASSPEKFTTLNPTPPHSDHISLSPPPGHSPSHSSLSSDRFSISHGSSPENEAPHSPDNRKSPPLPPVVLDMDVPYERRTVLNRVVSDGSSPENEKHHLPENHKSVPNPPQVVVNRVVLDERKMVVNRAVSDEPKAVANRVVLEEPVAAVSKADRGGGMGEASGGRGSVMGEVGGGRRGKFTPSLSILRGGRREKMVKRAGLGFRVLGFLFCLVSFVVMAADRNQGWAIDSFYRYMEFRYCISVNVLGFVYSGAQALDLSYNLATGKHIVYQPLFRHHFDFVIDQIIAYLLISASSSAATRIDDWQSNWGKDKFPDMASASVSMSCLAFVAVACSALISGYALCTSKSV